MKTRIIGVAILAVSAVIIVHAQQPAATGGAADATRVVARVNSHEFTQGQLNTEVQARLMQLAQSGQGVATNQAEVFERQVLEDMINRELVLQEGRRMPPTNIDAQVKAAMDQIRDNIVVQDTLRRCVEREVQIKPEDCKLWYDQNRDTNPQLKVPATVRASHILIKVPINATDEEKKAKRAQIESVKAKLKAGEKFADLAKQYSEDTNTAANGGDVGFFARGSTVVPEFDTAAFSLKPGETSDIITTQIGYHLIQVTDQKPARMVPFDEVKDKIEQALRQQKGNEAVRSYIAKLRTSAKIETLPAGSK